MNKALIGTVAGLALVAGSVGAAQASSAKVDLGTRADLRSSIGQIFSGSGEVRADVKHESRINFEKRDRTSDARDDRRFYGMAWVTAIEDGTITAEKRGTTWTIQTDSETRFLARGEKESKTIDSVEVGSLIAFRGEVIASDGDTKTVDATAVYYWNGTDKGKVRRVGGTIESVNEAEGTVVLDTPRRGDVTVEVASDTEIVQEDGDAGALADLVAGAKVRVKGMWDSVSGVFTAVKVKIVG